MAHIGLLCPPLHGHLNPMMAVGRALQAQGHRVCALQIPAFESRIHSEQLEFRPLEAGLRDVEELSQAVAQLGVKDGLAALRFTLECGRLLTSVVCGSAEAIRAAAFDLLIVDDNLPAGGSVAEHLGIPFVTLGLIPLLEDSTVPPPFVPWTWNEGWIPQLKNGLAYAAFNRLAWPIHKTLNRYRRQWKLRPVGRPEQTLSRYAQLSQLTEELDFPRAIRPPHLHYLGSLYDNRRPPVSFPWDKVDESRPLIYISFGTLQNRREEYFKAAVKACDGLDAQLVISTGGDATISLEALPQSAIVVPYAPQLNLLERASLCITHGGLNTAMECLLFGVPTVIVPITNDQPAVAARVSWSGAGKIVPLRQIKRGDLAAAVREVLETASYRMAARRLQRSVASAGGIARAVAIVEQLICTSEPVTELVSTANAAN